jgi:hypothetical protein
MSPLNDSCFFFEYKINNFIKSFVKTLYKTFFREMKNGMYSELGLTFMMSRSIFGFGWFK